MTPTSDRDKAAQLAKRIQGNLVDTSVQDEAARAPEDRPPGFADALMSEKPASVERAVNLEPGDWELIVTALKHYAGMDE